MKPLTLKQALILRATEGCSHRKTDFSTGDEMDKTGYRNFLRDVKAFLFGNASEYITKEECEKFFEDRANFFEQKANKWRLQTGKLKDPPQHFSANFWYRETFDYAVKKIARLKI